MAIITTTTIIMDIITTTTTGVVRTIIRLTAPLTTVATTFVNVVTSLDIGLTNAQTMEILPMKRLMYVHQQAYHKVQQE